jgi:hypothetical protein
MSVLKLFELASRMDKVGVAVTRAGLIVVLLWIGGLKAFRYEADGIVPFVANSPFMSFFYRDPDNYKAHKNPEGALVPENRSWHEANRTYEFAYGLGAVIVLYGMLLCLHPLLQRQHQRPYLPLLPVQPLRQRPRPVGCGQPPDAIRCRRRPVPASERAATAVDPAAKRQQKEAPVASGSNTCTIP